jgi:hypothetical protein
MSTFYGSVQGGRGEATRRGFETSGIRASVQSYEGSIISHLYKAGDQIRCRIMVSEGSAKYGGFWLYDGPLADLIDPIKRRQFWLHTIREDMVGESLPMAAE